MKTTNASSLACAIVAISMGSSSALAPRTSPSTDVPKNLNTSVLSRRSAALALIGTTIASTAVAPAFAKDDLTPEEKEFIEYQKEKMRKKIEASKKNYRKTNDLVDMRKKTTDYSCLDKQCNDENGEPQKKQNFVSGLLSGAP